MRARGALIGFVLVVVVAAIVLYLSAENWKSVAPQVQEIVSSEESSQVLGEEGGELPGLGEMKAETDAHSKELEEALAATE